MTVITRVAITEQEPTKTNSAINQIAEYIDTNETVWANIKAKVGSFTRDTSLASGTQAVTGVGFKPKAVLFLAGDVLGSNDASIGVDDGTTAGCLSTLNSFSAGQMQAVVTFSIEFIQSAVKVYAGVIQSLDTDGFTISWTKFNTPTGTKTIYYLALG